jgi:adenylate cyclase
MEGITGGEQDDLSAFALPVKQKVVLVIDLVESVRLMAADERGTVERWHAFTQSAKGIVGKHRGRVVKSLGDGLMAEFDEARGAVACAHALHNQMRSTHAAAPMHLRAGLHSTPVYVGADDIFGSGVNLAARIATLAGPGETVVTAEVREAVTDGLDATLEDLGECYLKHLDGPVRAYRAHVPGSDPIVVQRSDDSAPVHPVIAVIPFADRGGEPSTASIGELLADSLIAQLARSKELKVISRLSSTALRGRTDLSAAHKHLQATHVLSGSYLAMGQRLLITAEVADADTQETIWAERITGDLEDLFGAESQIVQQLSTQLQDGLLERAAELAQTRPLPTLTGHSLLLGGISLAHRTTYRDFYRAKEVFEHLADRHQRYPALPAWMAKWYVLEVAQGWSADAGKSAGNALALSSRALDLDSSSALALAMDGFVRSDLLKDFDGAMQRYNQAIQLHPSEPVAWLFKGLLHGFRGEATDAGRAVDEALKLSPLDPAKYFFDSLAASAYLSAGNFAQAVALAERSLRANTTHVSTFRALVIAQAVQGELEGARANAARMLKLDPGFTVRRFLARRSGGGFNEMSKLFAEGLRAAGVPE